MILGYKMLPIFKHHIFKGAEVITIRCTEHKKYCQFQTVTKYWVIILCNNSLCHFPPLIHCACESWLSRLC